MNRNEQIAVLMSAGWCPAVVTGADGDDFGVYSLGQPFDNGLMGMMLKESEHGSTWLYWGSELAT